MDPILWIAVIAFVVAAVFSAVGLGGGLIYMPLLLMLGVSFHRSAALSLAIIAASTLSAAAVYLRARKVSLPMLLLLEPPSVAGAFAAGRLSYHISERALGALLAATMLTVAVWTWHRSEGEREEDAGASRPRLGTARSIVAVLLGFAAGALSASVGVGGGVVKVPAMLFILGAPIKVAVATSTAMITITSVAGLLGHISASDIGIGHVLIPAASAMIGAQIGSRMALEAPAPKLRKAFAAALVVLTPLVIMRTW